MKFHELEEQSHSFTGDYLRQAIKKCAASPKFFAGDMQLLPSDAVDLIQFAKLPFPTTSVEFTTPFNPNGGAAHFIVTCEQINVTEGVASGAMLLLFSRNSAKEWLLSGALNSVSGQLMATKPAIEAAGSNELASSYMRSAFVALGNFFKVLNCSNVDVEEVAPSLALNKKRQSAGKPPIYTYKVLTIRRGKHYQSLSGTAESRRVHLVRGHIKRRKSGNFWWQPFVRGDRRKGMIAKDYRADKLIASHQVSA